MWESSVPCVADEEVRDAPSEVEPALRRVLETLSGDDDRELKRRARSVAFHNTIDRPNRTGNDREARIDIVPSVETQAARSVVVDASAARPRRRVRSGEF